MSKAVPTDLPYDALLETEGAAAVAAATIGASGSVSNGANNGVIDALLCSNPCAADNALTGTDLEVVVAAQKMSERKAKKAVKDAQAEKANRTKALQHQKQVLHASGCAYNIATDSTTPERKPFIDAEDPAIRIGAFVQVAPDLRKLGAVHYGGKGYVIDVAG